jgi:hypothetical protein
VTCARILTILSFSEKRPYTEKHTRAASYGLKLRWPTTKLCCRTTTIPAQSYTNRAISAHWLPVLLCARAMVYSSDGVQGVCKSMSRVGFDACGAITIIVCVCLLIYANLAPPSPSQSLVANRSTAKGKHLKSGH